MVFIIGMLFSCENKIEVVNSITSKEKLPAESAKDIEILFSESGKVKMKLTAPILERYFGDNPYVEFPEGVLVEFYDSLKRTETSLKSNYAINRESDKIMEAKYDVVVVNEKGEILNTEHLIWNQNTETIHTDQFVKITTADEILMGDGLEADQQFNKYKILKPHGIINIKEDEDNQDP